MVLTQVSGVPDEESGYRPCLHFVGFRDNDPERYQRAVLAFGRPAFVHPAWDLRAVADVAPEDTVIFASQTDFDRFVADAPIDFAVKSA